MQSINDAHAHNNSFSHTQCSKLVLGASAGAIKPQDLHDVNYSDPVSADAIKDRRFP
jgi:hypothetical protein